VYAGPAQSAGALASYLIGEVSAGGNPMKLHASTCAIAFLALVMMGSGKHDRRVDLDARLSGYLETPASISSSGKGSFEIEVDTRKGEAEYELEYEDLEGSQVLFAHVHLGQPGTSGGVMVFLCSNMAAPVPTPACPGPEGGEVTGTLTADDVVGPSAQGIEPGEFDEFVRALRRGAAYVNVHTDLYPTGELRGNIED
jgi:hypothetical protein